MDKDFMNERLFDDYLFGLVKGEDVSALYKLIHDDAQTAKEFRVYVAMVMGICQEAEQSDIEFGHALKCLTDEELKDAIGLPKASPELTVLDIDDFDDVQHCKPIPSDECEFNNCMKKMPSLYRRIPVQNGLTESRESENPDEYKSWKTRIHDKHMYAEDDDPDLVERILALEGKEKKLRRRNKITLIFAIAEAVIFIALALLLIF